MTVSTIGVADASSPDKYLHTNQRTISSTAREDQYVLPGESAYPTYNANAAGVSVATNSDHVMQVMGDGSNYCRLRRIFIIPNALPAAAAGINFYLYRLSTAGTGGTSVTPAPYDTADTYGGGAMTLPSSKGTEGTLVSIIGSLWLPSAVAASSETPHITWTPPPDAKPIIFGTATSNGIAVKVINGVASVAVNINIEFIVTSYL